MERRKFVGVSLGGLATAKLAFSRPAACASDEAGYAAMRQTNREFTQGRPLRMAGLHAKYPLPPNGRQLARRRDGAWFLTYASYVSTICNDARKVEYAPATAIRMSSSRLVQPGRTPSFGPEEVLVGKARGYPGPTPGTVGHVIAGEGAADVGTEPSMVMDSHDILHLVWVRPSLGEVWYARCDVSGANGAAAIGHTDAWRHVDGVTLGAERIAAQGADLGDICLDRNGRPCVLYRHSHGIALATHDREWRYKAVVEGQNLRSPLMMYDRNGTLHLIYCDTTGLLFYLRSEDDGGRWAGADGRTRIPELIGGYCQSPSFAVAGGEIFVVHSQGHRVITFSHYDGRRWQQNTTLAGGAYDHTSPMLTVDKHDVVWMHMVTPYDWTRTCRWQGDGWSDLQEGRRLSNMAEVCSAERVMHAESSEFGVLLANMDHGLYFDTFTVPTPTTAPGQHTMFLDLWEVGRLAGVEQFVEPLRKDPRNPLFNHGEVGSWDGNEANLEGTIMKDGDRYRLWYMGMDVKPFFNWKSACGYAESVDGVNWTKPDLGLYAYNGSEHNNICYPSGCTYNVLRMPVELEANPARRYRMAFDTDGGASLAYSPDGIHWMLGDDNPLWGHGRAGEFDENVAEIGIYLYDPLDPDPEQRYKAYVQTLGGGRDRMIGLMISPDGIHFKPYFNNPVIDPALGGEKQTHLIEVCFLRHGVFISLYGCYLADGKVDARLAVSRDGVHWVRVKNEVPFLPNGAPGSFDAGNVWPSNYPIFDGEDIWIYYSGVELTLAEGEGHSSMGRGRVRLDGFGKMRLRPGLSQGTLTTVAFQVREIDKARLLLNMEVADGKGSLRVEVVDGATELTLPGYSAEECHPLTEDGVALPVSWRRMENLKGIRAESIRLRFHFSGSEYSPRLCSFGFE